MQRVRLNKRNELREEQHDTQAAYAHDDVDDGPRLERFGLFDVPHAAEEPETAVVHPREDERPGPDGGRQIRGMTPERACSNIHRRDNARRRRYTSPGDT